MGAFDVNLCVQWEPSESWERLNLRRDPAAFDKALGAPCAVNCQGVEIGGFDYYHARAEDGALVLSAWNDEEAVVWTFRPLGPDPALGGAINTAQDRALYVGAARKLFTPPDGGKLGWPDDQDQARASRSIVGWRTFAEHLGIDEVPPQRSEGRYAPSEHTRTYFQRDTNSVWNIHFADHENAMERTGAAAVSETASIAGTSNEYAFVFVTPSNEPLVATWPTGTYRAQLDVTAAGGMVSYGLLEFGALPVIHGGFFRVEFDTSLEVGHVHQSQAAFTGTGLKLATASWTPPSGSSADRYGAVVAAMNLGATAQSLTLRMNGADSFVDAPFVHWTAMRPLALLGVGY